MLAVVYVFSFFNAIVGEKHKCAPSSGGRGGCLSSFATEKTSFMVFHVMNIDVVDIIGM